MGVAEDFAPSFTQKPQLRQEDDGNKLIFECQLLSSPKPEIQWYRSDTLLSEDSRTIFKIQSIGTNKFLVVLELDDVIETDAGLYKVKAKNKMGEVSASINLNFSRKCLKHNYFINIIKVKNIYARCVIFIQCDMCMYMKITLSTCFYIRYTNYEYYKENMYMKI